MGWTISKAVQENAAFPRAVSNNFAHPSAFVSVTRFFAGFAGYVYASKKMSYIEAYVADQDAEKAKMLREAEIDPMTLRGHAYHGPNMYDPQFTEYEMTIRDRYPDYYLNPQDEFVYQVTRGREKERQIKETLHTEAVEFLKQWQAAESS